jgi:hypothetical protein
MQEMKMPFENDKMLYDFSSKTWQDANGRCIGGLSAIKHETNS